MAIERHMIVGGEMGSNRTALGRMKFSKGVSILICRTCEHATLRWQRGMKVADGIRIANQLSFR